MRMVTVVAFVTLCGLAGIGITRTAPGGEALPKSAPENSLGRAIGDFSLRDFRGKPHSLDDYRESKLVVVTFLGTECPLAKLYGPRLAELSAQFADKGVQFLGIDSNKQDTLEELEAYARRHKVEFPLLKDGGNTVADKLGAIRTPEVFVLDQARQVRYQGRIDDQYGVGYQRSEPERQDLRIALEELLAGKDVSMSSTKPVGCFIGRTKSVGPHGEITFSKHISAILNRRCVECHREEEIGPFPLTSFDDAASWADTISEVISEGRMPPWFANPKYGHFDNSAQMPEEEKALVYQWIENGCPEGDPAELPPPPKFITGWRIPKPDLVVHMSEEPFAVPAEGVVDYKMFVADPGFTEDKYVIATEARPDNRSVVHHIVVSVIPPDGGRRSGFGNMIASYAPGMPPEQFPQGTAQLVPAGSKFVFQLHYTPNGSEQSDCSYAGFVFADKDEITQLAQYDTVGTHDFRIPPNADNHEVTAERVFEDGAVLYSLTPHMHLRGKSFRYEAMYPDGTQEILLDVPRYDFNWQARYDFVEPKQLPKGTRLVCTAHFDNSDGNLANPDASATVTYGNQTWEEMMYGLYLVVLAK